MGAEMANEEMWRALLTGEHPTLRRGQRMHKLLPSSPRCKMCNAPFRAPCAVVMGFIGHRPSRMNPRFCSLCDDFARSHPGGAELELTLLFADICGSTTLAERLGTTEFTRLINRFYVAVTDVLVRSDGLIDRLVGDEVIAIYLPGFIGPDHAAIAARAAEQILHATGHADRGGPWVPVGAGVHTGTAFVDSVGTGDVADFTVLGDSANTTARLAGLAKGGELLISEAARAAAKLPTEGLEHRQVDLKGRAEPLEVWAKTVGGAAVGESGP